MVEHTTTEGVLGAGDLGMGGIRAGRGIDGLVPRGFAHGIVGAGGLVDLAKGTGRGEGKLVGGHADDRAVILVLLEVNKVAVTGDGLEVHREWCYFGQERARVSGEGVKEDAVNGEGDELKRQEMAKASLRDIHRLGAQQQ